MVNCWTQMCIRDRLNYARWNSKSNAYDSSIEKTVYEMNDNNVTLMLASTK